MAFALMYDSDNETYPPDARYIAAYVDGSRTGRNYERARAAHPDARFLLISAVGDVDADVIDIEPGNVWPPENAIDWTMRQRALGKNPGYYCNTSTRPAVLAAYAAVGVDPGWWWRADYPGPDALSSFVPDSLPLGEAAWQYANPPRTGSHWDVSVIGPDLQAYLDGVAAPASAGAVQIDAPSPAPVKPPRPPWPAGFGPNDYLGDINGPSNSHGGDPRFDGPDVIAAIRWAQQMLILGGNVPGITDPNSSWADGRFEQPTVDAVAAWQRRDWAPQTQFFGQIWADDYDRL